jgi:hypothetical protein
MDRARPSKNPAALKTRTGRRLLANVVKRSVRDMVLRPAWIIFTAVLSEAAVFFGAQSKDGFSSATIISAYRPFDGEALTSSRCPSGGQ